MKAFRIDRDGVAEVDIPEDFDRLTDFDWDCVQIGSGHEAWVRDDALFQAQVLLACLGDRANVPLPAYVLRAEGENTVAATMSLDELRGQVRLQASYEE